MELLNIVAQMPPPPPPPVVPPALVDLPALSLWTGTDNIIQMWQANPDVATGAQIVILVGLVLVGLAVVIYYMRSMAGGDK